MTSAWSITASANPPRAVFTDFPLGNTSGPPGQPAVQRDIVRRALELPFTANNPGIVPLDHQWATEWKSEARELRDHRTPREALPQYQLDADRVAAIERHGEDAACGVC